MDKLLFKFTLFIGMVKLDHTWEEKRLENIIIRDNVLNKANFLNVLDEIKFVVPQDIVNIFFIKSIFNGKFFPENLFVYKVKSDIEVYLRSDECHEQKIIFLKKGSIISEKVLSISVFDGEFYLTGRVPDNEIELLSVPNTWEWWEQIDSYND